MRNIKEEDKWEVVGESDGPKKFFQQTGLTKGDKYSFRVYTINKAGKSGPSEPTPWAVAKPRKCKIELKINGSIVWIELDLVR